MYGEEGKVKGWWEGGEKRDKGKSEVRMYRKSSYRKESKTEGEGKCFFFMTRNRKERYVGSEQKKEG